MVTEIKEEVKPKVLPFAKKQTSISGESTQAQKLARINRNTRSNNNPMPRKRTTSNVQENKRGNRPKI
jgi:hypothetical protein